MSAHNWIPPIETIAPGSQRTPARTTLASAARARRNCQETKSERFPSQHAAGQCAGSLVWRSWWHRAMEASCSGVCRLGKEITTDFTLHISMGARVWKYKFDMRFCMSVKLPRSIMASKSAPVILLWVLIIAPRRVEETSLPVHRQPPFDSTRIGIIGSTLDVLGHVCLNVGARRGQVTLEDGRSRHKTHD